MISSIVGTIHSVVGNIVEIDTASGVSYAVAVPLFYATELYSGQSVRIPTYLKVTDQSHELYGFRDQGERAFFLLLFSVSWVRPKTALHILSRGDTEVITSAISRGDVAFLTAVQGIGKKTAERIVVELKGKVAVNADSVGTSLDSLVVSDVISALLALGYSESEARGMLKGISPDGKDMQTMLREILRASKKK
mgnify:CR=1 FL=1